MTKRKNDVYVIDCHCGVFFWSHSCEKRMVLEKEDGWREPKDGDEEDKIDEITVCPLCGEPEDPREWPITDDDLRASDTLALLRLSERVAVELNRRLKGKLK